MLAILARLSTSSVTPSHLPFSPLFEYNDTMDLSTRVLCLRYVGGQGVWKDCA